MNLPAIPSRHGARAVTHPMHVPLEDSTDSDFTWREVKEERRLELLEYWRSITKRKWSLLGLAAAAATLAGAVTLAMTPIYRASTTVLIEAGKGKVVAVEEVYSVSQQREHYQTQVELIKSRKVAEQTARALQLWNHPELDPRLKKPGWTKRLLSATGIGEELDIKTEWTDAELADAVAEQVGKQLTVTPVRLSQLVFVEFQSKDPELAARVSNALAEQYILADREVRSQASSAVSQQLTERLSSLRSALETSEKALQAYREKKGLVSVGGSAQANTSQQLGSTTERMLAARAKRLELEGQYSQIKSAGPAQYGSVPAVLRDVGVSDAQRLASTAQAKLAELQSRLGPAHEQVKQAQAEVAETSSLLQQRQAAVAMSVMREYEAARATEVALEKAMGTVRDAAQGVNREEFQLAVLEREYQSNRQLFDMFMSRAKETSLLGEIQPSVARIADMAKTPKIPVAPKRLQIVLISALIALLLGALASVAIDRLDNTIKGSDDAESRLRSPVLASLPEVPNASRKLMTRTFLQDPHSNFAEGIRTARTGIMLTGLDVKNKILLVTSSLPGEGKTTVAINLAFAHAQSNGRTLLIDCDMRRAQTSRALGLGASGRGLTQMVSDRAVARDCIVPIEDTGLFVLPVGIVPPNPLELLMSQSFRDVLAELSEQFQMIVIDSPPVELVSEALVLAPLVTQVAVVVKSMSTPAPLVRKTQQRLQRAGGHLIGVVVNGMNFDDARRYYGEYEQGSYSYDQAAIDHDSAAQATDTDTLRGSGRRGVLAIASDWMKKKPNSQTTHSVG